MQEPLYPMLRARLESVVPVPRDVISTGIQACAGYPDVVLPSIVRVPVLLVYTIH